MHARAASLATAEARDFRTSMARLGIFALGVVAIFGQVFAGWPLVWPAFAAGFVVLLFVHDRVHTQTLRARAAHGFAEAALARLDGRPSGRAYDGAAALAPDDIAARDLDLVGPASLFTRLDATHTQSGAARLAAFLTQNIAPDVAQARQDAAAALGAAADAQRADIHEALAVASTVREQHLDVSSLTAWGQRAPISTPGQHRVWLVLAAAQALWGTGALLAWAAGLSGARPVLYAFVTGAVVLGLTYRMLADVARGLDSARRELSALSALFAVVETLPDRVPDADAGGLTAARAAMGEGPARASVRIAALSRAVGWLDAMRNAAFLPIGILTAWPVFFAVRVDAWRTADGPRVAGWLDALAEVEALCTMGLLHHERPAWVLPRLQSAADIDTRGPRLLAMQLAHPLLGDDAVANAIQLGRGAARADGAPQAWVLSGSNMAGKSTWMRTIGTSVALARAGGVVRGGAFETACFALGATMRVEDNLADGASRFYAEITRLKALMDTAEAGPMLFFVDEVLHGTNSSDRQIGALALLGAYLDRGALGIMSTHDLAIAQAAEHRAWPVENHHLADSMANGKPAFDYRVKPGIVTRSNALEWMHAVGLPIAADEAAP